MKQLPTARPAPHATVLGTVLALALAAGCVSPHMAVRSIEPGRVVVGATDHLEILDGRGRRSAREWVALNLAEQARWRGYFSVEDRSEEGFEVRVAGRRVSMEGEADLGPRTAGLRIDVLEWSAYRDEEEVHTRDAQGHVLIEIVAVVRGNVLLAVTLFDAQGQALLAEAEYEGHYWTEDLEAMREEVIEAAASEAVSALLEDITPTEVVRWVRLDDGDPGQETILATARAGNVALAVQDLRSYVERNPLSASATYNLAVLLESTGAFAEALEAYDRALSLGGQPYYVNARAQCAARLAAANALRS